MYEIALQAKYRFFGIGEVYYKLVMDEMYEIIQFIAKFEYSRICIVSVARV